MRDTGFGHVFLHGGCLCGQMQAAQLGQEQAATGIVWVKRSGFYGQQHFFKIWAAEVRTSWLYVCVLRTVVHVVSKQPASFQRDSGGRRPTNTCGLKTMAGESTRLRKFARRQTVMFCGWTGRFVRFIGPTRLQPILNPQGFKPDAQRQKGQKQPVGLDHGPCGVAGASQKQHKEHACKSPLRAGLKLSLTYKLKML